MKNSPWHVLQPEFPGSEWGTGLFPTSWRNRVSVLRLLLKNPQLSQRRSAEILHLRASTLSNITAELREAGLVEEGKLLSINRLGPPEHALRIPSDAAWGCGLEVDERGLTYVLVNGGGAVVASEHIPGFPRIKNVIAEIPNQLDKLRRTAGFENNPHGSLSLSIPGIVNYMTGKVVLSRALDLENLSLRDQVETVSPVPVWVDRNVIYGAYQESLRAEGQQWGNFAYFLARTPLHQKRAKNFSLGMSFVIGNRFYRGFNHAAGELDLQMFPDFSTEIVNSNTDSTTSISFLEYSTRHLASVVNLMDVGKLIVAADPQLLSKEGFAEFVEKLRARLLPMPQRHFSVRLSSAGPAGVSTGAALFALHRSLEDRLRRRLFPDDPAIRSIQG